MIRQREARRSLRVLVARRAHLAHLNKLSRDELHEYLALTWALRRFRNICGDLAVLSGVDLTYRRRQRQERAAWWWAGWLAPFWRRTDGG